MIGRTLPVTLAVIGCALVSWGTAGHSGSLHHEPDQGRRGKQLVMGDHVHVRLSQGLSVSEDGNLIEHSLCRCGATFYQGLRRRRRHAGTAVPALTPAHPVI
jgi:hypothetical protein